MKRCFPREGWALCLQEEADNGNMYFRMNPTLRFSVGFGRVEDRRLDGDWVRYDVSPKAVERQEGLSGSVRRCFLFQGRFTDSKDFPDRVPRFQDSSGQPQHQQQAHRCYHQTGNPADPLPKPC